MHDHRGDVLREAEELTVSDFARIENELVEPGTNQHVAAKGRARHRGTHHVHCAHESDEVDRLVRFELATGTNLPNQRRIRVDVVHACGPQNSGELGRHQRGAERPVVRADLAFVRGIDLVHQRIRDSDVDARARHPVVVRRGQARLGGDPSPPAADARQEDIVVGLRQRLGVVVFPQSTHRFVSLATTFESPIVTSISTRVSPRA